MTGLRFTQASEKRDTCKPSTLRTAPAVVADAKWIATSHIGTLVSKLSGQPVQRLLLPVGEQLIVDDPGPVAH